jgi:hypothetical protein
MGYGELAEQLGMCGCGRPEDAYNFVRSVLACFDRRNGPWVDAEEKVAELLAKTDPALVAHVFSHLLNGRGALHAKEPLEHGGAIGGSWLTPFGIKIVDGPEATEENEYDD